MYLCGLHSRPEVTHVCVQDLRMFETGFLSAFSPRRREGGANEIVWIIGVGKYVHVSMCKACGKVVRGHAPPGSF